MVSVGKLITAAQDWYTQLLKLHKRNRAYANSVRPVSFMIIVYYSIWYDRSLQILAPRLFLIRKGLPLSLPSPTYLL